MGRGVDVVVPAAPAGGRGGWRRRGRLRGEGRQQELRWKKKGLNNLIVLALLSPRRAEGRGKTEKVIRKSVSVRTKILQPDRLN